MSTVLHIELPRAFTMGIREFDVRTCMKLEENGFEYSQVDLNTFFWEFMFRTYAAHVSVYFDAIVHRATEDPEAYMGIASAFSGINEQMKLSDLVLNSDGLYPLNERILESSLNIQNFLDGDSGKVIAEFYSAADRKFGFDNREIISLGVTGRNSFLLAFGVAKYIGEIYPQVHVCIGRHHYENFSLLLTLENIVQSQAFFKSIHSISLYEEKLAETLLGILSGSQDRYTNCAWLASGGVVIRQPVGPATQYRQLTTSAVLSLRKFISSIGVDPCNMHYNMQLIGNQCYYSKCTFCAQINKHLSNHVYEEDVALNLSFSIVQELAGMGVRYFSFTDEALRPHDLTALSNRIQQAKLAIRWNMRLIANTKVNVELIEKLYAAGCREVLFGLETIDPEIATAMGKVSSKDEVTAVNDMVFNFTTAGIQVILSMIYGFPGFGVEKDEELISYARKMLAYNTRVIFIFNRFVLFGGTPMFRNPVQYGITRIAELPSESDLQNSFVYEPVSISLRNETAFRVLNLYPCKNPSEIIANAMRYDLFRLFHHLRYSSFGFTYMQEHKSDLYSQLTRANEEV